VATDWIGDKLRRTALIGLAFGIAMIAMIAWLASRRPATNCGGGTFPDSHGPVILASRVVLRPWYGPHHIYGIFLIPNQYRDTRFSPTVTVVGVTERSSLSEVSALGESSVNVHGDNIKVEPGHYLAHAHIRTRVALWLLVTGHFGDLRATCNWTLMLTRAN
jgi:hypothetical protein